MQNPALDALNIDYRPILACLAIFFVQLVVLGVAFWKLFAKAGQPGWKALIPIYSAYIMLKMVNKPWWWLLLMLIPLAGVVWAIWALNLFIRAFGKQEEYTVLSIFFPQVFFPALAFDKSAVYTNPADAKPYKI
ncbi:hypothetical protein AM493_14345 [Flavobacterium akiainvivens]|uniref:Signal peptidase I n=1 Tax=Flavobacterium akiainvivens TaxID=1202724 RepID=A0A0M9VJ46_9FLAO|nr:DUF5684 domain-containing protein [Flavobacterium akiainvivens]KOS07082.1 hypothetical protein AM493_14345 [Flavobacterium akiainvivens]SFQ58395.1 hypothetical protein SAMN05444144_1092 [Flavobacterium akiainvivens]